VLEWRLAGYSWDKAAQQLGVKASTLRGYLLELRAKFVQFFGYNSSNRASDTNRRAKVHKKQQLKPPPSGSPCRQGEPTPTRFPSRSGGNLKEGGNCKLCPCDWYDMCIKMGVGLIIVKSWNPTNPALLK